MTKLSDTQLMILSAACQRLDHNVLPLPASLKGGAAQKVVGSLLVKGLVEEAEAKRDDLVWRTDEDGRRIKLLASGAGLRGARHRAGSEWGRSGRRSRRECSFSRPNGPQRATGG